MDAEGEDASPVASCTLHAGCPLTGTGPRRPPDNALLLRSRSGLAPRCQVSRNIADRGVYKDRGETKRQDLSEPRLAITRLSLAEASVREFPDPTSSRQVFAERGSHETFNQRGLDVASRYRVPIAGRGLCESYSRSWLGHRSPGLPRAIQLERY